MRPLEQMGVSLTAAVAGKLRHASVHHSLVRKRLHNLRQHEESQSLADRFIKAIGNTSLSPSEVPMNVQEQKTTEEGQVLLRELGT